MPILLFSGSTSGVELGSVDGAVTPIGPEYVGPPQGGVIEFGSVDGATPVPGISVLLESVAPDPLQPNMYFELFNAAGVKISDLATQTGCQFQEALNDVGSGSFTLQLDDTDAALVQPGTEVRAFLFGEVVFSFPVLSQPRIRYVDQSEEAGQTKQTSASDTSLAATHSPGSTRISTPRPSDPRLRITFDELWIERPEPAA